MSKPLRVRRLTPQEGQQLQRIVRRGGGKTDKSHVKWRRALVVHASAGGNTVPVIAQLAATSEDRVREMIHRFNEMGMRSLDPQWAGGRPRQITTDDERFIIETAATRPEKLGQPFTRWSIRKLVDFLAQNEIRVITIGRERLRQLLVANDITFQRTKTWKESNDPDRDAKLDRIEHVLEHHPDRTFAFDEFGPLAIRPRGRILLGASRAATTPASELPQAPRVRQFHGCYSVGDDELWGVVRHQKSAGNTLRALQSIRARRPDGEMIYVILDNLSAHKARRSAAGPNATRSSCASPPPTAPGRTRSRPTSGRSESSC
jgi:transposase